MGQHAESDNQIYSLIISAILLLIGFYMLKIAEYFIPAICIGLFIIYVTRPIYGNLERFIHNKSIPIAITIIIVISITLFLGMQFSTIAMKETVSIINNPTVSNVLANEYNINTSNIEEAFLEAIHYDKLMLLFERPDIGGFKEFQTYSAQIRSTVNMAIGLFISIGYILIQLIIAFMIAFYGVRDREKLKKFMLKATPLQHKEFIKTFIKELDISLNNIFMGFFVTSVLTGALAYIIFIYFNLPYPMLLALLTGILTLIPIIGAWLIYTPISIIMFLNGDPNTAVLFFALNLIIVSSVPDWITKPLIMASEKKMNLLIVMIGFIGGAYVFGPMGVIIGPILVAITASLIYAFMLEACPPDQRYIN